MPNPTQSDFRRLLQLLVDNARTRGDMEPGEEEGTEPDDPEIVVQMEPDGPHLYLFGPIADWWGVCAEDLREALAPYRNGADVYLHINSPGGDVFEGRAMAAAIVAHPGKVHCIIDGLCASAATYPALACSTVRMVQGGMFMIHEGWTCGWGNKRELAATVELLTKIDSDISADYCKHSGASADQVNAWMEAETWFTASEAKAAGFVDEVVSNTKRESLAGNRAAQRSLNAARWNLSAYAKAPKLTPNEPPAADPRDPELDAKVAALLQRNRNRLRLHTA